MRVPPRNCQTARRRLDVRWLERKRALPVAVQTDWARPRTFAPGICLRKSGERRRAFTVLEMLLVITIIGFLAAMALPHMAGMTRANVMTAATRQMLDDVALARQRALANRSSVYMVFLPGSFWNGSLTNLSAFNGGPQFTNLINHQFSAYALLTLRTVGDQPGRSYPHYLTDWRYLPDGVFIAPFKFNSPVGAVPVNLVTTNTLAQTTNNFGVWPFATNAFPFPSVEAAGGQMNFSLPYIAFSPRGQLASGQDEYIPLTRGSIFSARDANGIPTIAGPPDVVEAPPGESSNNCNIIHINWLTARAKLERNQMQ